jgi:4-amino-4-deoxy-L-arabinose transferase-like glycosyltransferase
VRRLVRRYFLVAILALAASSAAIVVNQLVFRRFSGDDDDTVYVFQAKTLLAGHVTLPARAQAEFFRPWLTGVRGDRLIFPYQYGWPAVLAASERVLGSMQVALGLVAGALVLVSWLFAKELVKDRTKAAMAAGFVLASPFVVVQGGTYLSYTFSLLLGVTFGFFVLRGLRLGSRVSLVAGGVFLGFVVLARPYDAVLVAIPFGVYALATRARQSRSKLAVAAWVTVGLAGPLLIAVSLNTHLTGHPFTFPQSVNGGSQGLGFGARRLAANTDFMHYSVGRAARSLGSNLVALPKWFFGGVVATALAVASVFRHRRRPEYLLLAGLAVVFPLGYFFWWGSALQVSARNSIGPHYYLPSVVPVAILAADALIDLMRTRRALGVGAAAMMVLATALAIPGIYSRITTIHDDYERDHRVIAAAHLSKALVFLLRDTGEAPYVLHPFPFLQNRPDLTGPVLYASEHGAQDLDLLARAGGRTPYRFGHVVPEGGNLLRPDPFLTALSVTRGSNIVVTLRARQPSPTPSNVRAYVADGTHTLTSMLLDATSAPGSTYTVEYRVSPHDRPGRPSRDRPAPAQLG